MHSGEPRQVDVVFEHHDISDLVSFIESSRGVGYDQRANSAQLHNPHRHSALKESCTVVIVIRQVKGSVSPGYIK